jgi:hypothetical protein
VPALMCLQRKSLLKGPASKGELSSLISRGKRSKRSAHKDGNPFLEDQEDRPNPFAPKPQNTNNPFAASDEYKPRSADEVFRERELRDRRVAQIEPDDDEKQALVPSDSYFVQPARPEPAAPAPAPAPKPMSDAEAMFSQNNTANSGSLFF